MHKVLPLASPVAGATAEGRTRNTRGAERRAIYARYLKTALYSTRNHLQNLQKRPIQRQETKKNQSDLSLLIYLPSCYRQ